MTISSSLNAGVMGLSANAIRLGTISDNIANSGTYGYKRSSADFQALVVQSRRNAYSAGGVQAGITRDVEDEGSLLKTGNKTDLAISGRGMLPVTNQAGIDPQNTNREFMMVPTGSFKPDANGYLRTPSGHFLLGWPADSDGNIGAVSRQSPSDLEPVRLNSAAFISTPTRNIELGVNLPADATAAGAKVGTLKTDAEYFDNLGRSQTLSIEFKPSVPDSGQSNSWSVEIFDNSSGSRVSVGTFDVKFKDSSTNGGTIESVTNNATYDAKTGEITVKVPSGDIQVAIGRPEARGGLQQLATKFSPYNVTRDGTRIGNLVSAEVDSSGRVQAIYDNSFRQVLYQVPVADVNNMNGLESLDAQAFRVSQSSGDVYFWDAGSGPTGEIAGSSLMSSTVDVATELTQLIETQRAYSSNAKIIQTVDEMLQETTNIIR